MFKLSGSQHQRRLNSSQNLSPTQQTMTNSKQAGRTTSTQPTELLPACCTALSHVAQLSIWQFSVFLIHAKVSGRVANTNHFSLKQFSRFQFFARQTLNRLWCSNVYMVVISREICVHFSYTCIAMKLANTGK